MLSEKSVELNLTAELLNFLWTVTGSTHTAIGPSQAEESKLGFDVSFHGSGVAAALVQYKRAYVDGAIWTWRLNRTKKQDQHQLLQILESLGYPVVYAFPLFATPGELVALRRKLLRATAWYPPSAIKPPGGPTGHHEVSFDTATGTWWVASPDRVELSAPHSVEFLINGLQRAAQQRMSIEEFAGSINQVMSAATERAVSSEETNANDNMQGQALLIRASEQMPL